jgi:predicted  nucleic acid-binding Zn-ribbon protein
MEKSSAEISQEITDKEREINEASKNRDEVKLAINAKRRTIHKTQMEIKDLEDSLIKSECIVRERKTEHSILKDLFWRVKSSGL